MLQRSACRITLLFLMAIMATPVAAQQRRNNRGQTAQASDRLNVVVIFSDDLTASALSCYGNPVCQTPNLQRLASEGVRFHNAYCQMPLCGPSRASLMSGLYPNRTKMLKNSSVAGSYRATNPELANHPSIGGFFREQGYQSVRVSKIFHMGIPNGIVGGTPDGDDPDSWNVAFNVMAPEYLAKGDLDLLTPKRQHFGSNFTRLRISDDSEDTQADVLASRQAVACLESLKGGEKPFFLAVGLVRPHVPLVSPARWFDRYSPDAIKLPEWSAEELKNVPAAALAMRNEPRYGMNEEQQRQAVAAYYACVSYMDEQVGRILDALDRLKLREKTIVVFMSDHGYQLGEHDCWQKLSLFEPSARVPLIISVPGTKFQTGVVSNQIVESIDLYPTLAELTGLGDKAPKILQGQSLVTELTTEKKPDAAKRRDVAYTVTLEDGESIRTPQWRFTRWGNGDEELYDHKADPTERHNLIGDPQRSEQLAELRALLEQTRQRSRE